MIAKKANYHFSSAIFFGHATMDCHSRWCGSYPSGVTYSAYKLFAEELNEHLPFTMEFEGNHSGGLPSGVPRPRGEGMVVVEGPVAWRIKGEIMIMFDGQENSLDNHSLGLPPGVVRPREGSGGLATGCGGGVVNEVRRPWEVRVLPVAVGFLPLFLILELIQVTNLNIWPQCSMRFHTAPLSLATFSLSSRMLAGVG